MIISCGLGDNGKYLDITDTYCIASCYADNTATMLNTKLEECVYSCEINEY